VQADILHRRPDDCQATALRREHVDLIGALAHITEQAFNGVGGLNVPVHGLRKGIKREEMFFVPMHARLIIGQYRPGKADEGMQMYRESILPEARQQRGFKGAMALLDRSTDKGMSITLWETEADAQASGTSTPYLQEQLARVASLLAAAPVVETYEVTVQE
jgi:heme-degrading monooxygenase HmoA